ncbi:thiamine transporter 2-like isoform X2 [Amphiura filiformis]|uniref:thiamine transporter 2-like isoform X2 n=1 Tax=Amphiura filiformis TaxID=82378 RepID=UPI003B22120E
MAGREWVYPSMLLCLYGFFKQMRPSEPFLTPYLVDIKNISENAVNNQIYPIWTYSYMIALVPVFLFTDFLRYKPVIIFESCTYLATWALLLWAWGIPLMKLMQMFYGLATATEIAYYSYIYAVVSEDHYQQVSSYTRSAVLTGSFIAGVLGQLIYSLSKNEDTLYTLHIISFTSVAIATIFSLFLPKVDSSTYFHRNDPNIHDVPSDASLSETSGSGHASSLHTEPGDIPDNVSVVDSTNWCIRHMKTWCNNFRILWLDFKTCYSDRHLLKWSLWWAFATCGYFQVGNYIQNLWQVIFEKSDSDVNDVYNGAVEAASTLAGALAAFCVMFLKLNWNIWGEILLGFVSVADSILLVSMATTNNIWLCYSFYILFRASYQLVITIATYQIAKQLSVQRYALVFGCNMFVALVLQSLLTVIVVDYKTLNAPPETQFLIYSGCFFVLGAFFCCKAMYTTTVNGWRWSWLNRWEVNEEEVEDEYGGINDDASNVPPEADNGDEQVEDPTIDVNDEELLN